MLQKALTLTNEAGKAFINSWILNFSADGKADVIAVFTPAKPGNFFYAVVKAEKRPEPYSISLPFAGSDCLPTFFWLTGSLKKDARIYNINTFPLCRFAPSWAVVQFHRRVKF